MDAGATVRPEYPVSEDDVWNDPAPIPPLLLPLLVLLLLVDPLLDLVPTVVGRVACDDIDGRHPRKW